MRSRQLAPMQMPSRRPKRAPRVRGRVRARVRVRGRVLGLARAAEVARGEGGHVEQQVYLPCISPISPLYLPIPPKLLAVRVDMSSSRFTHTPRGRLPSA